MVKGSHLLVKYKLTTAVAITTNGYSIPAGHTSLLPSAQTSIESERERENTNLLVIL